jgi:hypothetical protein
MSGAVIDSSAQQAMLFALAVNHSAERAVVFCAAK